MTEQNPAPRCGRPTASTRKPCRAWPLAPFGGCVTHLSRDEEEQYAQQQAERDAFWAPYWQQRTNLLNGQPSCWGWPVLRPVSAQALSSVTAETQLGSEGEAETVLRDWQAGRCAICGSSDERLVVDHDHQTGLVRGLLCRQCNTNEGTDLRPGTIYQRYRELPPTHVLGVRLRYWDSYAGRHAEPASAPSGQNPLAQIAANATAPRQEEPS